MLKHGHNRNEKKTQGKDKNMKTRTKQSCGAAVKGLEEEMVEDFHSLLKWATEVRFARPLILRRGDTCGSAQHVPKSRRWSRWIHGGSWAGRCPVVCGVFF